LFYYRFSDEPMFSLIPPNIHYVNACMYTSNEWIKLYLPNGTRRELQLYSQQVSETRNRLNGVKLLVPVIADRECDDVVPCTPREGFARGDWGEICRKSVLSHPRLPVRMPVAARESRPVHGRTLSPFRTLSARSHPLLAHPLTTVSRPLSLGHRCVYIE